MTATTLTSHSSLTLLLVNNQTKFDDDYSSFLAPKGGYPVLKQGRTWSLAKDFRKHNSDYAKYMTSLAETLVKEGGFPSPLYNVAFIARFNTEWMNSRYGAYVPMSDDSKEDILFNSKSQSFGWLSNFFPTLIFYNKDEGLGSIAYSLEISYKAFKYEDLFQAIIKGTDSLKAKQFNASRVSSPKYPDSASCAVANASGASAGSAKSIKFKRASSDSIMHTSHHKIEKFDRTLDLDLMVNLVKSKFNQNPILARWLMATGKRTLVEDTADEFWGRGVDHKGQNQLGLILMRVRAALSSQCSAAAAEPT